MLGVLPLSEKLFYFGVGGAELIDKKSYGAEVLAMAFVFASGEFLQGTLDKLFFGEVSGAQEIFEEVAKD